MRGVSKLKVSVTLGASLLVLIGILRVSAEAPANQHFQRTWNRTDKPVADLVVSRTWMWGPEGMTGEVTEPYSDAPGGFRQVQYFDKSRMEITFPNADPDSIWYVTNGLLVVELISGRMQLGNTRFEQYQPSMGNVAGDPDDTSGPTYAAIANLLYQPPLSDGSVITQRVDRNANVTQDPALAEQNVTVGHHVQVPGIDHQVATPFWEFMNSAGTVFVDESYIDDELFLNPFFATGFPIIEPYWTEIKVGGILQLVLFQCFERRCLTYTPDNAQGWQVEAGNVGQHYYHWRYVEVPSQSTATPTMPPPTTTPSVTATAPTTMSPSPSATETISPTSTETETSATEGESMTP